jgi:hypothetical protein
MNTVYIFDNTSFIFFEWEMFGQMLYRKSKLIIYVHFFFIFTRESCPLWDNVEKYLEMERPQMTIWRTQSECWIAIPESTHTHSVYVILIAFQCSSGYMNAFHCYVIRALSVLLVYDEPFPHFYLLKWSMFVQRAVQDTSTHSADRTQIFSNVKVGYTLLTLPRTVTPYRDSVDGTRDDVTYQKLVTR